MSMTFGVIEKEGSAASKTTFKILKPVDSQGITAWLGDVHGKISNQLLCYSAIVRYLLAGDYFFVR